MSDTVRGVLSNGIGLTILFGLGRILDCTRQALIALVLQWGVAFLHGLPQNSEKFYDASGSVTHLTLIVFTMLANGPGLRPRPLLCAVAVVVWLTRLGSFLFARILRDGRDERFVALKRTKLRFLGAWTVQAVWVFLVDLPVLLCLASPHAALAPAGLADFSGACLWVGGFLLETVADTQKFVFRSSDTNKGKYITSGLWGACRHPNYCGELMMWIGLCSTCSAGFRGVQWLGWISPLFTAFLLLKVTGVPALEKSGEEKWGKDPHYRNYMKHTNLLLPGRPAPSITAGKAE